MGPLDVVDLPDRIFGLEGAGVIRRVGPKVREFVADNRVMVLSRGLFSADAIVPETHCKKMPPALSIVDGATVPCTYATAIYSLFSVVNLEEEQ
ncbi:hypothetical protein QQS21_006445, partial [Conoideocrella luteorostrata]